MSTFGDPDPFGTPESASWTQGYDAAERDLRGSAAQAERETRRRGAAQARAARETYGDDDGGAPPRRRRRQSGGSGGSGGRSRRRTVSASDAERTMAWQLVVMWTLMLLNDLAPGTSGRGGTSRGQALPKPRQFLAAAIVWIALSFPAQSSKQGIQHVAVLFGWFIVLAKAMQTVIDNPNLFTWLSNIASSPGDLFPPSQSRSWNAATLPGYSGGLTPAQAQAQAASTAAALQNDFGMSPSEASAYASELTQMLQYPQVG